MCGNWCKEFNSARRLDAIRWRSKSRKRSDPADEGLTNWQLTSSKSTRNSPLPEAIERAAAHIRRGDVVAIPTEASVHAGGRSAESATRSGACSQPRAAKSTASLPLLISGAFMAEELAKELSARFHLLARHFWPGPLTIIVPASAKVPLKVTGNTGRLAMRQSRSRVAQALLDWLDQPLIATSANISGQPTCRSGIEVFGMMDGRVDLVLDGGPAPASAPPPWTSPNRTGRSSARERLPRKRSPSA